MNISPAELESSIRALCIATETSVGIDVTMPVMLPNGDLVSVTVLAEGDSFLVHDSSSAAMSLAISGVKITKEARKRFAPLAARYGCEIEADRIFRRVPKESIGVAAMVVANASRAVADMALEIRRRVEGDFKHSVESLISQIVGKRARFNQELAGSSGRMYHVQNVILSSDLSKPIAFVEPVSSRSAVATQFTEFFDLRRAFSGIELASIYNDQSDIRASDTKLLAEVSSVMSLAAAGIHVPRLIDRASASPSVN